jgi:5-methylcytosine-specific restriction protein A
MRREFPAKVRVAAFQRANGQCESCTARLVPGKFAYDHDLPDWLGGEPVLSNCRVLCDACHGAKTAGEDVPRIAKAKRQRAKHAGIRPPSQIQSRGFPKPARQARATTPLSKPLPPRRSAT